MALPALRLIPGGADNAASPEPISGSVDGHAPAAGTEAAPDAAGLIDARLVRRLLVGDQGALEELYRRHAAFAFNMAVRLQGHSNEVEDLVHDAFLKAHAELAALRDGSAFRAWFGSIVVNQVRARIRRGRVLRGLRLVAPEVVDIESIASPSAGPDVRAQLAQVYALMRLLPADERIAWTLRHVERHRLEEVAELVGCSLATVKRRLLRAQRFLDDHFVEPGYSREPVSDTRASQHPPEREP
jgi:RNA polymerase sigma-70 factor, ECF subfamily